MGSVTTPSWSRTTSCATLQARHLDGGAVWTLELSGEADLATLGMLKEELAQVRTTSRDHLVVDVAKLTFCDVASAHLLRTARRTIPVTLSGATGSVRRVFDLLDAFQAQGLPRYLPVNHPLAKPLTRRRLPSVTPTERLSGRAGPGR